ncbi:unnamed protein product [Closterium sp. NIES-65]|nr:unnamed protein product [Closterium sp. NIES-65]
MTGKRRSSSRSDRSVGSPATPSHSQARGELAPALLRAAAAWSRTRRPAPPPVVTSQSIALPAGGPIHISGLVAAPIDVAVRLDTLPLSTRAPPPPAPPSQAAAVGAPLVLPAVVPPTPSASSPGDPPQRLHPLIPLDPSPVARFPPPRCHSPPLPPNAPDPEDDEAWWNGDSWESPPQFGTLWGRDWDIRSDFVLDVLRWEWRMIGVGECLSHVATALEQLHASLEARNLVLRDPQLTEPQ